MDERRGVVIRFAVVLGIVAVLGGAMLVRGCARDATERDASPPATFPPSPTAPAPDPVSLTELEERCSSPGPVAGAAAYQGPGPHPVALFEGPPWFEGTRVAELAVLPEEWTADGGSDAQLLFCATVDTKKKVDVCEYEGGITYDVWSAEYVFTLYEAATGTLLDELTVFASGADHSCHPVVWSDGDDGGFIAEPPGDEAYSMVEKAVTKDL